MSSFHFSSWNIFSTDAAGYKLEFTDVVVSLGVFCECLKTTKLVFTQDLSVATIFLKVSFKRTCFEFFWTLMALKSHWAGDNERINLIFQKSVWFFELGIPPARRTLARSHTVPSKEILAQRTLDRVVERVQADGTL